jgi:hypothetical protein
MKVRLSANHMISYGCPWCGQTSSTKIRHQSHAVDAPAGAITFLWVDCSAATCGRPTMLQMLAVFVASPPPVPVPIIASHPPAQPQVDELGLPGKVLADYTEALRCEASGLLLGAAIVGRRVLQWAVLERGGAGKNLMDQINSLPMLSTEIKAHAHEVRHIGNDAAHPDPKVTDEPTTPEATRDLLEFTDIILDHLYRFPARLDAAKKRRLGQP